MKIPAQAPTWYLYIAKCRDETLYTGITTDIPRPIKTHNAQKGAFYTKNKLPVKLVYQELRPNQSEARKREAAIKRLTRKEKLELIYAPWPIARPGVPQVREDKKDKGVSQGARN